ncbi:dihydroxy-acid dehydratase ilv3, partial [Kickxella alabastrina]
MLRVLQSSAVKAAAAKRIVNSASSTPTASRQLFSTSTISREQDGQKGQLNRYSATITQPKSQGPSQAMLYGTGMKEVDMSKGQVGISSV